VFEIMWMRHNVNCLYYHVTYITHQNKTISLQCDSQILLFLQTDRK
jgi:hypothetical protein